MRVPFYWAGMSVAEDRFAYFSDFPFPYELCGCLMRTIPSRFIVGQQVYSVPDGKFRHLFGLSTIRSQRFLDHDVNLFGCEEPDDILMIIGCVEAGNSLRMLLVVKFLHGGIYDFHAETESLGHTFRQLLVRFDNAGYDIRFVFIV